MERNVKIRSKIERKWNEKFAFYFRSIIIGNIKWGECMKESKILEYKENTNNNF